MVIFLRKVYEKWWPLLAVGILMAYLVNAAMFYPSFLSTDSLWQLCQAKGDCQLDSWHPVSTALVWRALLFLSGGAYSSMLLVQLLLFWAALGLLSYYLWYVTHSRKISLLPIILGFLPNIINISGVIWKDNQMAFSLLLATAVLLIGDMIIRKQKVKNLLFIISIFFIGYATTTRVNALAATIPMVLLVFIRSKWFKPNRRNLLIVTIIVSVGLWLLIPVINIASNAHKSNSQITMMLLDVVNLVEPNRLQSAPNGLRPALEAISKCSHFNDAQSVNLRIWECTDGNDGRHYNTRELFGNGKGYEELQKYWRNVVMEHPIQYIFHKVETYSLFVFPGDDQNVWQNGINSKDVGESSNRYGLSPKYPALLSADRTYTYNFGYKYFPFLYKAWFWLVIATLVVVLGRRGNGRHKSYIILLGISAILNILSYALGSLTPDYRFIYWSVIACLIAALLIFVDKYSSSHKTCECKNRREHA